ncbi:MAG: CUAEP/CCAEP-tail radical SAM protein [Chloroflexota bacterium]
MSPIRAVLISTYDLGRQPFGLASPAAWLAEAGATVTCLDLAVGALDEQAVAAAGLIGFHVPMHTATRLTAALLPRVRALNPHAHLCVYGLYAPLNAAYLQGLGADSILGGEFEAGLVALLKGLGDGETGVSLPTVSLARQRFRVPLRAGLPALEHYAHLVVPGEGERIVGYTEATRGCLHLCRHCPIPPVYNGTLRVVAVDTVLADIARQVQDGARHITFGDPDFFNGPAHALRVIRAMHASFPMLTFDATIKVEHLLRHARHLPELRAAGCAFITSAVEAVDDAILEKFAKGHTRADIVAAIALCRQAALPLNPTFVTFTPWTSRAAYQDLLAFVADHDLVASVAPVQNGIRLLIPAGSLLLECADVRALVEGFDESALCYRWSHPDPAMDDLCVGVLAAVRAGQAAGEDRRATFERVWDLAATVAPAGPRPRPARLRGPAPAAPYLSEPWYC